MVDRFIFVCKFIIMLFPLERVMLLKDRLKLQYSKQSSIRRYFMVGSLIVTVGVSTENVRITFFKVRRIKYCYTHAFTPHDSLSIPTLC